MQNFFKFLIMWYLVSILLLKIDLRQPTMSSFNEFLSFLGKYKNCVSYEDQVAWKKLQTLSYVWEKTNRPMESELKNRQWSWIGHTLRKPWNSITKQAQTFNKTKIHQSYFEFSFYLVIHMDQIIYAFIPVNRENTLYYCNVMILLIKMKSL